MSLTEKEKEFGKSIITFFEESTAHSSKPIRLLAEIQEKFPEQYAVILKVRDDPSLITENKSMPDEIKSALLLIVLKASKLGSESQRIYDMDVKEKNALADKFDEFSKFITEKLKEIVEKNEKK